jgi:hypothetical protein
MSRTRPLYWDNYHTFALSGKSEKEIEKIKLRAIEAADEYRKKGYLQITPKESLKEENLFFYLLYESIGADKFTEQGIPSPVAHFKDSSWMLDSDFCFLNIRACSTDHKITGTIADALKLLPVIRASSFHIAPFFDCTMDNLYAVDSLRIITQEVVSPAMLEAGMAPHEQLLVLLDSIHILGKTAGFDLEPHTSQFSRVVLENPQHFRWLRLKEDRSGLYEDLTHEEMFAPEYQKKLVKNVRSLVKEVLDGHKLSSVEDLSRGVEIIRAAHGDALNKLIEKGYWTLPSHTWNGVGLPRFETYNKKGNYPDFTYLDEKGEDQRDQSFGMLTPFGIYTNLPFNQVPTVENPPLYKQDTFEFMTGLFPAILSKYPFDIVRIDYVDHVFDSTVEKSWDIPSSDRMAPKVLQAVIDKAREVKPYLGAMAERMGQDIWDYRTVGFDLVLGQDVLTTMHQNYLTYCLETQEKIESLANDWETPASILFAVDTHDSGHPLFWTMPLSRVVGPAGLALRHYLSRFLYNGRLRRPKYEVMGNQDLSYGLYEANNRKMSLTWKGDKEYNKRYHALEDVYSLLKELIRKSSRGPGHFQETCAFWFHDYREERNARLLCVALLEKEVKKLKDLQKEKPVYKPLEHLEIDVNERFDFKNPEIVEFDLITGKKKIVKTEAWGRLVIKDIEPLGTRLYMITDKG